MENIAALEATLSKAEAEAAKRDKQIAEYEAKLKEWKSAKRAANNRAKRVSEKLAEQRETERLIAQGELADKVFDWMRTRNIGRDGQMFTVWDLWERDQRGQNPENGAAQ